MAPDIAKVDPDRHLHLGVPAWNFSDEVLRRLLHGKQSLRSDPKDLLIPFIGTDPVSSRTVWGGRASTQHISLAICSAPTSCQDGSGWGGPRAQTPGAPVAWVRIHQLGSCKTRVVGISREDILPGPHLDRMRGRKNSWQDRKSCRMMIRTLPTCCYSQ